MSMIGHNEPDGLERIRVIRVHINDWVASTRGLSLEEEGFFWRFTLLQYDRMGSVVDDDLLNSRHLNLDLRVYRRLKQKLVDQGKIRVESRMLTHPRIVREIEMYVAEHRRRSQAAKDREDGKRNNQIIEDMHPTSSVDQANFPDNSLGSLAEVQEKSTLSSPELTAQVSEKPNGFKGSNATTVVTSGPEPSRAPAFPKPKPISKNPHKPPKGGVHPLSVPFEEFWKAFPGDPPPKGRKTDKPKVFAVFRKIVTGQHRDGISAKAEEIIAGARRYAASRPDPEFVPMPRTWLNGARWQDGAGDPAKPQWWQDDEKVARVSEAQWRGSIAKNANGHWPVDKLSPVPGTPNCRVPEGLIKELRLLERYDENGVERASWKGVKKDGRV